MERNLLFRELNQSLAPAFDHFAAWPLVARVPLFAGQTVYLPVSLGGSLPAKTGVYLPANPLANPSRVNIVVYFHGMIIKDCQTDAKAYRQKGIEYYWDTPLFRCLREDFTPADNNTLLIAPTIQPIFGHKGGTSAAYGHLNRHNQFDTFIQNCLRVLSSEGHLPGRIDIDTIKLAGHSAGGLPMQSILTARNDLGKKITTCIGFDSHYYASSPYIKWLEKNPGKAYYHFGAMTAKGGKSRPWLNAAALAQKLPNAHCIPVPEGQKIRHCEIVKYWWGKVMK